MGMLSVSVFTNRTFQRSGLHGRVAQNEEIFERSTSLGGLVFLQGQYALKNVFLRNSSISRGPFNITNFNRAAQWGNIYWV